MRKKNKSKAQETNQLGDELKVQCQFEWKPSGGLSELREDLYQLALEMVDKNSVVALSELNEEGEVEILVSYGILGSIAYTHYTNSYSEHTSYLTLCEMASNLVRNPLKANSIYKCHITERLDQVNQKNKEFNLFYIASYIKYLQDLDQQDVIEEAREKYHQREYWHNSVCLYGDVPSFQLPVGLFVEVSDQTLRIAELLHTRNYVSLVRSIVPFYELSNYTEGKEIVYQDSIDGQEPEGWYVLQTVTPFVQYENDLTFLEQELRMNQIDRTRNSTICLAVNRYGKRSDILECIIVAGYLDYLDSKDQYEEYRSIRKYWDKIPKDNPLLNDQVAKVNEVIRSERESGLYCVIEGERGVGKKEITHAISYMLWYYKKIDSNQHNFMTFLEAATTLFQDEYRKYGEKQELLTQEHTEIEYGKFKKRTLYVLTDLKEFLHRCKDCIPGDGSAESHLIKVLGRYQPQTYIIVIGEKKYIERFLELSHGIKGVFGERNISIPSISADKLYAIYTQELSENNKKSLQENPDFKIEFINYLVKNRNAHPWNNRELANYLADYSNNKQELCLPPTSLRSARKMLENVVGMEKIKITMNEFENYIMNIELAKMNGMELPPSNRHMFFVGNSGTGKTMIAELVAELLYDIGMIQEKKFKSVGRKDLVAGYIGQTATKVEEVIQDTLGGVLFIDEAYTLIPQSDSDFSQEAIATLITGMEKYKGELIVIFAGYEKEMQEFRNSNPGISSRIAYTFHFEDYTTEELVEIVSREIEKAGFWYREQEQKEIEKQLVEVFQHFKRKKNFGNGRFVEKVNSKIIENHFSVKRTTEKMQEITLQDIPTIKEMTELRNDDANGEPQDQLGHVIGMKGVKEKIKDLEAKMNYQIVAKKMGITPHSANKHMIFQGNPGTGKTMIARLIVQKLYDIGVIMENKFVEVERVDLVGEHVGETAIKVKAVVERALGGVLFIDEAYTLTPTNEHDFGGEAIATLIKAMEDYKEDLVVIFAGYEKEMDQFITSNSGIASRIGYNFLFEDYTEDELYEIFISKMRNLGYLIAEAAKESTLAIMTYFSRIQDFGNGRFVDYVMEEVEIIHGKNVMADLETGLYKDHEEKQNVTQTILERDIPSIEQMAKRMHGSKYMIMPERITDKMNEVTATHEIGHAFVQYKLFPDAKIEKITIKVGGDGAFGYMKFDPNTVKTIMTKEERMNWIAIYMAGIAAEQVFFGEYEEGGASDLKGATRYAKRMITALGMSKNGLAGGNDEKEIHQEVNEILEEAFTIASSIIIEEKVTMTSAITMLLRRKELTEEEFKRSIEDKVL
ncbi:MAG: AAA family ATPase [Eubacteriales bacterium]